MIESHVDTQNATWRKKIKKVNMLALLNDEIVFRPPHGRQFMLSSAYTKSRNHAGTNVVDPTVAVDNGTDGNNMVAPVALTPNVAGAVQRLAVVGNYVIDYDRPLRLQVSVAATGSTVYDVDFIFFFDEISEITS